jgi:hypothetical protein
MQKTVKKSKNPFKLTYFLVVSIRGAADFCIPVVHYSKKFTQNRIKISETPLAV